MSVNKDALLLKVAAMFRPADHDFLDHRAADVICGPNDRAVMGYDTYFPKEELVSDFGFTPEEADYFIATVKAMAAIITA